MPLLLMLMAANRHSFAIKSQIGAGNLSSPSTLVDANSIATSPTATALNSSAHNHHDQNKNTPDNNNNNQNIVNNCIANKNADMIKSPPMQNPLLPAVSTSFSASSSGETVIEARPGKNHKENAIDSSAIPLTNGISSDHDDYDEDDDKHQHRHSARSSNKLRAHSDVGSQHAREIISEKSDDGSNSSLRDSRYHKHKHREHKRQENHVLSLANDVTLKCDVGIQVDNCLDDEDHSSKSSHKSSGKSFSSNFIKSINRLNPFNGQHNQHIQHNQHNHTNQQRQQQQYHLAWYQAFAQRYLRRKSMQTSELAGLQNSCSLSIHTSQSAPATPVKWQTQRDIANKEPQASVIVVTTTTATTPDDTFDTSCLESSGETRLIQHSSSRPSVRFADNELVNEESNSNNNHNNNKQVVRSCGGSSNHDYIRAANEADEHEDCLDNENDNEDCLEEDGLEEEICEDDDFGSKKASEIVEKLFQFPIPPSPNETGSEQISDNLGLSLATASTSTTGECPMDSGHFRHYGYRLIDYICNYLDTIKERRVTPLNIEPGYLKSLIEPAAPESGEPFPKIMQDFEKHIMCGITHWQHPHFHAYFPAGNAYPSILADMLSDALGCVGFSWAASPAYTELEIIMLDWMGKMIGLPDEFLCLSGSQESRGGGVIQGSASECVLVNLLAARHWAIERLRNKYPRQPDGMLLSKLIGYCSKEAHSCVEKAAMIGFIRMRALETDENQSLRGDTLAKAIESDLEQGLEPFLVCATLGTTSCVSFDNLHELGEVCEKHDVWLHVDAAYAGSALICPEFKYLMNGIEKANSFNMNPNKWMLINFDCSLMWVKDRFKLTRAFVVDPLYLQHSYSDQAIDYRHWGIPLSRRFRALKLWFTIRNYGISGLQAYVRNHVKLAKLFETLIRSDSRFSVTNRVVLGLVCFRLVGSNALNQRLLSIINASGKLHMVPASVNGRYVIRFCICDQNAREEDVKYAYECIANFATELIASVRAGKERFRAISAQNTVEMLASALPIGLQSPDQGNAEQANNIPSSNNESGAPAAAVSRNRDVSPTRSNGGPASRFSQRSISMDSSRQATPSSPSSIVGESPQVMSPTRRAHSAIPTPTSVQQSPHPLRPESLLGVSPPGAHNGTKSPLMKQKSILANDNEQQQNQDQFNHQNSELEQRGGVASGPNQKNPTSNSLTIDQQQQDSEQFKTAQRRARVTSGRYKRKFFVRVVSDPRVYRASISGDINAHSSSGSLAKNGSIVSNTSQISTSQDGTQQPQATTSTATKTHVTTNVNNDELSLQEEKTSNN